MITREDQIAFNKQFSKLYQKCRFKGCIYPDKTTCSKKAIKAHSIQKSKVLRHIADAGMVISGDILKTLFTREFEEVGINSASTFFGFCNYHDSLIFSEIENKDYKKTQEQNFLYAYRACALEYVKKKETCCFYEAAVNKYRNTSHEIRFKNTLNGAKFGIIDLTNILENFSNELKKHRNNRNFNIISTKTYTLSIESLMAVNAFFYIQYDLQGKLINDLSDISKTPSPIFLNVFPQNKKTYILFSWLSQDSEIYKNILTNLSSRNSSQIEYFFSNLIIYHCENLFMSPLKYKSIPNKLRKLFVTKFMKTIIEPFQPDYLFEGTLNLFRHLKR